MQSRFYFSYICKSLLKVVSDEVGSFLNAVIGKVSLCHNFICINGTEQLSDRGKLMVPMGACIV